MDIDGDIKVWTDGKKACARLQADGPEGPIVVQASAPLGPIRRRLLRALARRGVTVAGDEPSTRAMLERIARKKALSRLRKMAPAAFARGGLASFVAKRELLNRRRRRRGLARAGQPVGAKPIGPVAPPAVTPVPARPLPPPARRKRRLHRRRRHFARWKRPFVPAWRPPMRPTLAPILPPPPPPPPRGWGGRAAPWRGPAGGAGASSPGGPEAPLEEDDRADDGEYGEDAEEYEETDEGGQDEGEGNDGGEGEDAEADEGDTGESDGDEGDGDDDDGGEDVGAEPAPAVQGRHVHQAMTLLNAADRHPVARRRVQRIVHLAQVGDPTAKKALTALKVAKHLKTSSKPAAPLPALMVAKPQLALAASPSRIAVPNAAPTTGQSAWRRWLDVFASWRNGIG